MNSPDGVRKAVKTLLDKNPNHFKEIGAKGGKVKVPKGFAMNVELARLAGRKGRSRRPKNK